MKIHYINKVLCIKLWYFKQIVNKINTNYCNVYCDNYMQIINDYTVVKKISFYKTPPGFVCLCVCVHLYVSKLLSARQKILSGVMIGYHICGSQLISWACWAEISHLSSTEWDFFCCSNGNTRNQWDKSNSLYSSDKHSDIEYRLRLGPDQHFGTLAQSRLL